MNPGDSLTVNPGDCVRVVASTGFNTMLEWIHAVVTHIPENAKTLSDCQLLTRNPCDKHLCIPVVLGPFLQVKAALDPNDVIYRKVNLVPGGKSVPLVKTKTLNQFIEEGNTIVAPWADPRYSTVYEPDISQYNEVFEVLKAADENRANILKQKKREREQYSLSSDSGKRQCIGVPD